MLLIPVHSRSIRAVGYDGWTLSVLFHSSDRLYTHHGVPPWEFDGLMMAASLGRYYNARIRGRYR